MATEIPELKNCPFCGAKAVASDADIGCAVVCSNEATCEAQTTRWSNKDQAAAAWNQRADHEAKVRALEELVREYRKDTRESGHDCCTLWVDGPYKGIDDRCDLCKRADALLNPSISASENEQR